MSDGRQSERALMIQNGVTRFFKQNDIAVLPEFTLDTGRRADLTGIDAKGRVIIVEIKSSIEDFKVDKKWPEYKAYCDLFYFASHSDVPSEIFPQQEGFILADDYGAEIIREAEEEKLQAARRKAIILRFARAAATRLERVISFADSAGVETPDDYKD